MKQLFSFIFIGFIIVANAQYGNEWIDYSQSYFSFKVAENGVYKIDYQTLNNAGFPVGSTSTEHLQLWGF